MAYNTHAYDDSPTICAAASAAITDPAMKAVKFSSGKLALPSAGDPVIGIVLADQGDVAARTSATGLRAVRSLRATC